MVATTRDEPASNKSVLTIAVRSPRAWGRTGVHIYLLGLAIAFPTVMAV